MEREIREYLSKDARNDKQSPFYQSISIHLPDNIYVPQGGFPLDFLIHFERIKEGRTYSAQVICTQNDRDIYFSMNAL